MDDIVKAAMAKWPHVPDCRGWLGLSARGDWYMRDDRTQAAGPFPQSRGSRVDHDKLKAFIERNYQADAEGRWFFQNGPQKVFVELEAAPYVWRLHTPGADPARLPQIHSHTGLPALCRAAWLDERGRLFLETDLGLGLVHSQDMLDAADALAQGAWPVHEVPSDELPQRFAYCLSPQSDAMAADPKR